MNYRDNIATGDRVALAPHLDLWMAGVRYGEVIETQTLDSTIYRVQYGLADQTVWLNRDDLLGAV